MAIDMSIPRTRRALLAGGIGGLAAVVASALGRPLSAEAANGDDVHIGQDNFGSRATGLSVGSGGWIGQPGVPGIPAWRAVNARGTGMLGESPQAVSVGGLPIGGYGTGVEGRSISGTGVLGRSETGPGVVAQSTGHDAVRGFTKAASKSGVYAVGQHADAYGLFARNTVSGVIASLAGKGMGVNGESPIGDGVRGITKSPTKSGVYGFGGHVDAYGVFGRSSSGSTGYLGGNGIGAQGNAAAGIGVRGTSASGTGLYGEADTGYALRTAGRLKFERCSGVATINEGNVSVTVSPGVTISASSFVILAPRMDLGTRRLWYTLNVAENEFTIRMSATAPSNLKVGWLLVG